MSPTHRALLLAALAAAIPAGCSEVTGTLFGTQGEYLFYARDVITPPNRPVQLQARLQAGTFLEDEVGVTIQFRYQGDLYAEAKTDSDGLATTEFTPLSTGDYVFEVSYEPEDEKSENLGPVVAQLLVASRRRDVPIAVIDLDKTLVGSGFHTVLAGDPEPMPGSVDVVQRIARDYTVVYLTHRPDYFGPKSSAWLNQQGYPRGPLLLGDIEGLIEGSGTFKGQTLQTLGETFTNLKIGIGDKISDVQAYVDNGMRGFLVIHPENDWDEEDYRSLAEDLDSLPDSVQVVTRWQQIQQVLYSSGSYPLPEVRRDLLNRASSLRARREEDDDEDDEDEDEEEEDDD
jgi:hypothetical protein